MFQEEQLGQEDLDRLESAKPDYQETVFREMELKTEKLLSVGAYDELEEYLRELEDTYRDSDDQIYGLQRERIKNLRGDLALLKGIQNDQNITLEPIFATPDVLASAVLYLPLSEKYESFLNLSCIAIPAITPEQSKTLQLKDVTPENAFDLLDEFNEQWEDRFVELRIFSAYLNHDEIEVVLLQDGETARWRPYTIRPKDGDRSKYISILKVGDIADYLIALNGLNQLDTMITLEDDASYYEENPLDQEINTRKPNC